MDQWLPTGGRAGPEIAGTTKGQVGSFGGDGYVYCLDCGDGIPGVFLCHTFLNGTLYVCAVCFVTIITQ